ncbi:MAG: hypothetical protein KKB74_12070 [Bacteroidetes bacterium]|nr:hypothetical protein [Bacteroidota bacterium]
MNDNKTAQIIVRLDNESHKQWLAVCDTFKGTTRSDVFRRIIKRLHSSIEDNSNFENYG